MTAVLFGESLQKPRADAQQPDDSARRDQSRRVEAARRNLALAVEVGSYAAEDGQAGLGIDDVGICLLYTSRCV